MLLFLFIMTYRIEGHTWRFSDVCTRLKVQYSLNIKGIMCRYVFPVFELFLYCIVVIVLELYFLWPFISINCSYKTLQRFVTIQKGSALAVLDCGMGVFLQLKGQEKDNFNIPLAICKEIKCYLSPSVASFCSWRFVFYPWIYQWNGWSFSDLQ